MCGRQPAAAFEVGVVFGRACSPAPAGGNSNGNSNGNGNGGVPVGRRGGSGCGGRRESPVRPNRWRLCVRALAKQCFASEAPSPMEARSRLARVRCPAHTARPGLGVLPNPPEACLGPMALTPPQPDPPRLRQFPAVCWNGSDPRLISISDRSVDQGRHLPTAVEFCQRWGGVGVRGVSRMDAAAKLTGTYLQRPRTPTPPRHPTDSTLLLLLLLLRLPASGRHYRGCRAQPCRTPP